jgi:predicted ATPase
MENTQNIEIPFNKINEILERAKIATEIKNILSSFEANCKNISFKKGIYIYGSPGCGKLNLLRIF